MLSPNEVANLLRFRLDATFLAYKNGFYKLTFGTAMGPLVSVTVAIFVMRESYFQLAYILEYIFGGCVYSITM